MTPMREQLLMDVRMTLGYGTGKLDSVLSTCKYDATRCLNMYQLTIGF